MPGHWAGSTRRDRLPPDWPTLRRAALARDGRRCRWVEHDTRCTARATDVDHIDRNAGDTLDNLQSLCPPHHRAKSSAEGTEAMRARRAQRYRPREQHPGIA